MTLQVQTTIDEVEIKGPLSSKTGEFDLHIYKTPDGVFTQAVKLDAEPEGDAGQRVEITYDQAKGKSGTYNKILKLSSLDSFVVSTSPLTKSQSKRISMQSSTSTSGSGTSQPGFSNKSARIGGLVHDAVAICVHNQAREQGGLVTPKMVVQTAKELLDEVQKHLD